LGFKDQLKKILTGLTVPQEYCCLELENLEGGLRVFLTLKNQHFLAEVSQSHLFLGYKPLVIGLSFTMNSAGHKKLETENDVCLNFVYGTFELNTTWMGFPTDKRVVARLTLRKIHKKIVDDHVVMFYEGTFGRHEFLNPIHQFINHQNEKFKRRPADNVGLPGNLQDQVRIAYAIPRSIAVITISDGLLLNMFPTDLHGPVGDEVYVGSLRIGGKANEQVERYKKLVVSEVETTFYKKAYKLGKNHMSTLSGKDRFSVYHERSEIFNIPLPDAVVSYRELRQVDSFDHGIHRIHFYEVISHKVLYQDRRSLAHIHQYYAQWRIDQRLKTTLFFR